VAVGIPGQNSKSGLRLAHLPPKQRAAHARTRTHAPTLHAPRLHVHFCDEHHVRASPFIAGTPARAPPPELAHARHLPRLTPLRRWEKTKAATAKAAAATSRAAQRTKLRAEIMGLSRDVTKAKSEFGVLAFELVVAGDLSGAQRIANEKRAKIDNWVR
jgi:hypothetical protein